MSEIMTIPTICNINCTSQLYEFFNSGETLFVYVVVEAEAVVVEVETEVEVEVEVAGEEGGDIEKIEDGNDGSLKALFS